MSSFSTSRRFPIVSPAEAKASSDGPPDKKNQGRNPTSDEELMARLRDADDEAFATLFKRHAPLVRRIASRILRNETEAQDVTQEVFLWLQQNSGVFDHRKSSAVPWIVQIAYKRAIERRRYLTTRHFYSREDIAEVEDRIPGPPLADGYVLDVLIRRNDLAKALGALSEDQRDTLRLYFFEGYSLAEISAKTGQPLGNVRHRYYRGLEKLRRQLFRKRLPDV